MCVTTSNGNFLPGEIISIGTQKTRPIGDWYLVLGVLELHLRTTLARAT